MEEETNTSLEPYITKLTNTKEEEGYNYEECFAKLPFDQNILKNVQDTVKKVASNDLKYIILIGIGGSNLGTWAVYEAFKKKLKTKILFADTVSENTLNFIFSRVDLCQNPNQFLVNVVCKSGETRETVELYKLIKSYILNKFPNANSRFVITTAKGSYFEQEALGNKFSILEIPQKVGGRYSVFSSVGLFPLCACGIDIENLLKGARDAFFDITVAKKSALIIFDHYKNGITIHNSFFFNCQLETLGKWRRQLIAESLGKDGKGILPIVSIGTADLHSVLQFYLGGQNKILHEFIYAKEGNTHFNKIMLAIYEATKSSFTNHHVPFIEFLIPEVNEYSIGYFLEIKMLETVMLGKLMGVDSFNQPNIEEYKKIAKYLLESQSDSATVSTIV